MAALPYIQLYVADYLADTAHLTTEQSGAYLLLIFNYWQRGQALSNANERLASICRLSADAWEKAKPVLSEFFDIEGDTWYHPRIEADLVAVAEKSRKASDSSKRRFVVRSTNDDRSLNQADKEADTDTEEKICTSKEVLVLASEDNTSGREGKRPDRDSIPVKQIVDLYHELLPALRRVDKITSARRSHIQQRWRDDLPTLDAWRNYFLDVASTPFLLGRGPPRSNGKPWRADLEWLCKEGNFAKVSEGKYS